MSDVAVWCQLSSLIVLLSGVLDDENNALEVDHQCTLFVKNLSFNTSEDKLREVQQLCWQMHGHLACTAEDDGMHCIVM